MKLHLVVAELLHRPKRTVAAVLSLALGVAIFLSLQAYSSGYRQAARAPLEQIGADLVAQREGDRPESFDGVVFPHSTAPMSADEVRRIQTLNGVQQVAPALLFWSFQNDDLIVALGVDPTVPIGPARLATGITEGRFLESADTGKAVLDASFAAGRGLVVGDRVDLAGDEFDVVGLVDTSQAGQVANANLYLPLADAQGIVSGPDGVTSTRTVLPDDVNIAFVKVDPAVGPAVAEAVSTQLGTGAIVTTPQSFDGVLGQTFSMVDRFGQLIGLVALLVAALGLFRSVQSNLLERRRDLAVLRAVGWTRRSLGMQFIAESIVLTMIGLIAGIGIALGAGAALSRTQVTVPVPWDLSPTPHFVAGGAKDLGVRVSLDASLGAWPLMVVIAVAMIVAVGCGSAATRRAARIKPAEAWRVD
ncbi:MAG: ABC transporter permease [Pseudonocardia sp.]